MRGGSRGPVARRPAAAAAPIEYAAAVDRYLAQASLGDASRRVYRISLAGWAWPLVGRRTPHGAARRGARPPVVPLARLDDAGAAARLAAAVRDRAARTDLRTVNREISALRSAVGWWQDQQWITSDPAAGLRHLAGPAAPAPALTSEQVAGLLRDTTSLREHALWSALYDTADPVPDLLALDADRLDLPGHRARDGGDRAGGHRLCWQGGTSRLLRLLLAGRPCGPVFLTERRAPAHAPAADVCPITGRARMSYRRAAEIFTAATRSLDPAGQGWTLHQLQHAGTAGSGQELR
jgi:site-specific recombinase XerD